jgi:hypothetical protein
LKELYDAVPNPKLVIACGSCAVGGGVWFDSYHTMGGLDKVLPVDFFIPGCPPRPEAILWGIAVAMGLVGVATVVTIALTAMASLVTPKQANISILIRLFLVVLASILGAYGILLGLLAVIAYIVSLRSFGAPYLAPIAPFNLRDFNQDVIRRAPLWAMLTRPRTIGWHNSRRQDNDLIPTPPPIDKDDGNSGQKHQ